MGRRSAAWNYFEECLNEKGNYRCKKCRIKVKTGDSSTSNLRHHLNQHHPQEYAIINSQYPQRTSKLTNVRECDNSASSSVESSPIAAAFAKSAQYNTDSNNWKSLTEAVTFCIAKDAMPISTVERPGFLHLLKQFDPRYTPPSRKTMSQKYLPKLYEITREKVLTKLNEAQHFASTTDMWSSRGMTPYMGFTVHFIDNSWDLQQVNLGTRFVPEDHTAETIKQAMVDMLQQWKLDPVNQVCITTDNGSNVKKAVQDLHWEHLSCFGHNLNLGITNCYSQTRHPEIYRRVRRALGVARKIVAAFGKSWKKKRDLHEEQMKQNKDRKCLISDCVTRWGSTQAMVKRLLQVEDEVKQVLVSDRKTAHLVPTWQDTSVLESFNSALEPLAELTDIMSGSKYVTASCLNAMLQRLEKQILAIVRSDDEPEPETLLSNQLRQNILEDLLPRYKSKDTIQLLNLASFLDPRFKATCLIQASSEDSEEADIFPVKNRLCEEYESLMETVTEKDATEGSVTERGNSIEITQPLENGPPPAKKKKTVTLGSWLGRHNPISATGSGGSSGDWKSKISQEIALYAASPCVDVETNPLTWWRDHALVFPVLATLAKKYLCIQASSSPSERLFSKAGQVITPNRTQLNPDKANMLVFLSENL